MLPKSIWCISLGGGMLDQSFSSYRLEVFGMRKIRKTGTSRQHCNLVNEEILNIPCHVLSYIFPLKWDHRQALKMFGVFYVVHFGGKNHQTEVLQTNATLFDR
ncbi:hypothetical protein TNCV_1730471 [Trichonephila clavipes]|nr:hypothetical protein TNCV_1730471 [Trichonephila clavipes]